jgi:MFS family permease
MDMEIFSGLKDGFRYIIDFKILKYTVLLLGWISLIGFPSFSILPVFVKEILKSGPKTFGFLMASSAIGSLVGAIYMAGKKNIENLEKINPLSTLIFGISLIFFSLIKNIYLLIFIIFISGLGMVIQMVSSNTLLQTLVDDKKRGRVMSFHSMAFMGIIPFGNLLIGSMAEKFGSIISFIISGVLSIIGGLLYMKKTFNVKNDLKFH